MKKKAPQRLPKHQPKKIKFVFHLPSSWPDSLSKLFGWTNNKQTPLEQRIERKG
jgi:hypothetical protein